MYKQKKKENNNQVNISGKINIVKYQLKKKSFIKFYV